MNGDRSRAFQTLMRQKGIAEASPSIPDNIGRHLKGVPAEEDLVEIPDFEEFPFEEAKPHVHLDSHEARLKFVQYQLQTIAANPMTSTVNAQVDANCVGPILEFPTEFDNVEDFVQFKRELATVYKARSDAYGWSDHVKVCKFPACMNSVAPTFDYCIFHLPLDAKFDQQGFIGQCKVMMDEHQCPIPCGKNGAKCAFHRALPRESNK